MNDAGKIAFTPKGDYSSAVTYEYLDTVVYNGNAYAALKTTTGNAPEEGSEYWTLLARGGTSVPVATEDTEGVVKASDDIGVDSDAKMILRTDFTEQKNLVEIESGESRKVFFGKIVKTVSELISHINVKASTSATGHVKLSDSSAVTDSTGLALPATEKNASISGTMANQISELNTNLTAVNTNLNNATKITASSTVTWSSDIYFGASGRQQIIKSGKICFLHLCFAIKTTVNSGGVVCLLPKGFFPKANISNYATIVYSKGQVTSVPIAFDVRTNGQIILGTTIDACAVELNCVYETA